MAPANRKGAQVMPVHAERRRAPGHGRVPRRSGLPAVNMPLAERVARVVVGGVGGPLLGLLAAAPADGATEAVLWAVAAVGTLDLVVSGLAGFCPLWRFVAAPWTPRGQR